MSLFGSVFFMLGQALFIKTSKSLRWPWSSGSRWVIPMMQWALGPLKRGSDTSQALSPMTLLHFSSASVQWLRTSSWCSGLPCGLQLTLYPITRLLGIFFLRVLAQLKRYQIGVPGKMYQGMVYSSLERSANYPLMQQMNIQWNLLGLFTLGTAKFLLAYKPYCVHAYIVHFVNTL